MREILFRGKRTDTGEWVEGDLFHNRILDGVHEKETRIGDVYFYDKEIHGTALYMVIPETIGQYTGLTDKNGKKIFEGDIILFEDESPCNYEYHDCTEMRCGEIKFDDGEFYLTNRIAVLMGDLVYDGKLDGEIIGNIHDNPELLNER